MKNSKNIRRIVLMLILVSIDMFSAIEVAFFFQKDLTASQIYIIYSIFSVFIFLLEVPTGYVGDKIGYKNSIGLGLGCGVIGFLGFLIGRGFWAIIISYFFMALMNAFISGSDDALLYDSLKDEDRKEEFEKVYAKIASYGYTASIAGNVIGGVIASFSMNVNVIVQLILMFAGLVVLMGIGSPKKYADKDEKIKIDVTDRHRKMKSVALLLVLAGFFMTSTLIGTKYSQQVMLSANIPIVFFGIFTAMLTVVASIFSYFAPKVSKIPFSLTMIIPSLVLITIGVSGNGYFILLLVIVSACRAIGNVKITALINSKISSKYRATINSAKSLMFRLFYSVIILGSGKIADYNVFMSVMISGIVLAVAISVCLVIKRRIKSDLSAQQ